MPETRASVDAATVRHRFNFDWAMDPQNVFEADGQTVDPYWWYATSIRVDPNEIWAEDEEGNVWVVSFTTDGADEVTFGEPVRSRLVAVPAGAQAGVAATETVNRRTQRVVADALQRPDKPAREGATTAAEARPNPEEGVMDENVRAYLEAQGIDPSAATEEQVNAANVFVAAGWTPESAEAPAEQPEGEPATEVAEPEQVAAAADEDGPVMIDRATLAELQAGARTAKELDAEKKASQRDQDIDDAIQAGKFPPSRREHYATAYDIDPEGTRDMIRRLAPGLVPVDERGTSRTEETDEVSASEMDAIRASFGITTQKGA